MRNRLIKIHANRDRRCYRLEEFLRLHAPDQILAESLADYTAMMVLEQEFGAEITRRFLRNRTRHYLQSRVAETDSEHPLGRSRIDQDYLFYSKGSLVIYQLRQLIGEDRINTALRNLLQKFGGGNPPYATSLDLLESLRQQTPIEHHQILDELFNQITLFHPQWWLSASAYSAWGATDDDITGRQRCEG